MTSSPFFSIVIPVYNRPGEVEELLQSLTQQTFSDFEVVLVEDGSTIDSKEVYDRFANRLSIQYFFKPNSGPGPSRNFGFTKAKGKYFVIFDSDCIIPFHYLQTVYQEIITHNWDAWGGPDKGHENFTPLQRAMAYTMSSVLTTGGIRGAAHRIGNFQPRSFNMGFSRQVYEKTGGFKFDRYAEDIELSIRMQKLGFKIGLISEAFVYHKRRTTLGQFFRQVSNFGKGRVLIGRVHSGGIKITHWFPFLFTLGLVCIPVAFIVNKVLVAGVVASYLLFTLLIFLDSLRVNGSIVVAILSMPAAWIQLIGYGTGFFSELIGILHVKK